jgi:hypothetical protein
MPPRHVRGSALAGLRAGAVAGCGTQVAPSGTADATASPATTGPAAAGPAAVGCASVNQATMVTVHRTMHLVEPARAGQATTTQRKPALVRALFTDFCRAVSHPAAVRGAISCPADFGLDYSGAFYDGHRLLARFVYGASGCQTVSITAAGTTHATMVIGSAAAAAPHLEADMARVLGQPVSAAFGPGTQVNPGGPDKAVTPAS